MRKKECPICGNHILVRTRPSGSQKVLVTEEQAAEIEKQWEAYHQEKMIDSDSEHRREYEQVKAQLINRRGTEPSVGDIRWALANKDILEYVRYGDWGLYRNTKVEMAQQLQAEKKLRQALATYLEVCYLDANGPCNRGAKSFDPSQAIISPGIIREVRELSRSLGLQPNEVKSLFIEAAGIHKGMRLPIDPAKSWDMIAEGNVFDAEKWEQHREEERLARGSGYDLLSVAEDRRRKLESSGAPSERYDEVLSILEAALTRGISPFTQAIVHRHIGEIQHVCGRDADAIRHLEMAISLNPKVGVKRLLGSLRK